MKKTTEIPEHLKKAWDQYRVLKSRSDHFGYKALLINGYPDPTQDERDLMNEYVAQHLQFYKESCGSLPLEFLGARWEFDGSCVLKDGIRLQYEAVVIQ